MVSLRPFDLARRQVEIDLENTRRLPQLYARKHDRMILSPHVLLRGTAPLFYEVMAACPDLGAGPEGEGWIVGDMHLENMGAFRNDNGDVVFDLNDFDDTAIAPWRYDVLRVLTSLILAARAFNLKAVDCIALGEKLLGAYVGAVFYAKSHGVPPMTDSMKVIYDAAVKRKKTELLDARAPLDHGHRRFVRGDRYLPLTPEQTTLVEKLLPAYVTALGERAPNKAKGWAIEDAAVRIAGTGSLGRLRFGILVKDDTDDERILDFKEAAPPSYLRAVGGSEDPIRAAHRVVAGARALLPTPPRLLAAITTPDLGMSFIGRQLCPQEDKLDVSTLKQGKGLREIGEYVGYIVGTAHARAAKIMPPHPWTEADLAKLLDRALELSGLFESVYLAYSRLN